MEKEIVTYTNKMHEFFGPDLNDALISIQDGDYNTALTILEDLSSQNDAEAQFNLGVMYHRGSEIEQNDIKALNLFEQAALQGHAKAQFNLGSFYANGTGTEQNNFKAIYWWEKASKQGSNDALYNIAVTYYKEYKDFAMANKWFLKSAKKENPKAQFYLGVIYKNGDGVIKDDREASIWFTKSAKKGISIAQYNLGVMYNEGEGVLQDIKEAKFWFEKAAKQGHIGAQYNLGVIYANGIGGVKQDKKIAKELFGQACDGGLKEGCDAYKKLLEQGY